MDWKLSSKELGILVAVVACSLALDGAVSLGLGWHGVIYLVARLMEYGSAGGAAVALGPETVLLLIVLAFALYLAFGLAVVLSLRARLAVQQGSPGAISDMETWAGFMRDAFGRAPDAWSESADSRNPSTYLRLPLERYAVLRMKLERPAGHKALPLVWRLQPKDLTGPEQLESALEFHVLSGYRPALDLSAKLDGVGELAATLGLTGTVIGLMASSLNLTDPVSIGIGLSAALIKMAVGYGTKFYCMYTRELVEDKVRTSIRKVIKSFYGVWAEGPT